MAWPRPDGAPQAIRQVPLGDFGNDPDDVGGAPCARQSWSCDVAQLPTAGGRLFVDRLVADDVEEQCHGRFVGIQRLRTAGPSLAVASGNSPGSAESPA